MSADLSTVRPFLIFVLVLVLFLGAVARTSPEEPPVAERRAVLKTLDSWNEGWRTRDAALAVSDYSEDTDWTNAYGDRFQGRAELQKGLEFIFGLDFVMAGNSEENAYQDITFLARDVAIVRSALVRKGQMTADGQTMRDRQVNHLRVLQKRQGRWVIVSHLISQAKEKGSL